MQVSKKRINHLLEKQILGMWHQLIVDIKNPEEAKKVMESLLSETEMTAITKRLAVGYWLAKKRSYENIRDNLRVSSATIAAVANEMRNPGWKLAMEKVTAEEWASKWEEKIKGILRRGK